MEWKSTTCPISGHSATEFFPSILPGTREFACPACGRYRIMQAALGHSDHLSLSDRHEALHVARARSRHDGSIPTITMSDFDVAALSQTGSTPATK
jgi:hypothetical protein